MSDETPPAGAGARTLPPLSSAPRWRVRPPGSNWGDFGPDDERGRLNLLTAEKVLQGIAEVREGLTF